MNFLIRQYHHGQDYERVSEFLIKQYRPGRNLRLWTQPRWEYMHYHPLIVDTDVSKIGIAEIDGAIRGVVHHEHDEGLVYFQIDPNYVKLTEPLLDYAEANYGAVDEAHGSKRLAITINEEAHELHRLAYERGYKKSDDYSEVTCRFDLSNNLPDVLMPPGFFLQSLAEENDLRKINQVLWRGFDHEGPAPEAYIEDRGFMQQAPNFRHDLTIVAVVPNGDYASFCGIWYVPDNRLTYVEPVATDPDYRRMGLGTAVVVEGIRRTIPLGSQVAWVGSNQKFYLSMGFEESYRDFTWIKHFKKE